MVKRVIILGHTGFIGGVLFQGLCRNPSLKTVGFSSRECNLLSFESIERSLDDVLPSDAIVMAAAITRTKGNDGETFLKNVQMVTNLCRWLGGKKVSHVSYISSVDVYGAYETPDMNPREQLSECSALQPDDFYSIGKVTSEFLLKNQCRRQGIPLAVLRFPGVYGPGDKEMSLVGLFIHSALKEKKIAIFGDGSDHRDYIYSGDLPAVIDRALETKFDGTLNIVTGKSLSVADIAEAIRQRVGPDCEIIFRPRKPEAMLRRRYVSFDQATLRKIFPGLKIRLISDGIAAYLESLACPK